MATSQISLGYYAVVPEPQNVTDDDRVRTTRVFERVFSTDAIAVSTERTDNGQKPVAASTQPVARRSAK